MSERVLVVECDSWDNLADLAGLIIDKFGDK